MNCSLLGSSIHEIFQTAPLLHSSVLSIQGKENDFFLVDYDPEQNQSFERSLGQAYLHMLENHLNRDDRQLNLTLSLSNSLLGTSSGTLQVKELTGCHLFQTNGILASFYLGYQKWYQKQDLSLITETGTGQISKPEINAGTGLSEKFPLSLALECANNLILDDEVFPTCICCPISIYMTPSIFKGEAQIQPSSGSRIKPLRQLCRKQFETPELDAKVLPGTDVMSEPFLAIAS
ncbi:hypothetical protein MG293_001847 [Ovis ammon polii]|uniref:Uncharacterized protein n=1 Tax=Ovis ammon polii TaxID=230172 RepID=A0AAD4UQT0_OVIAM|nr:hypothetical protein MG293_001847 [Ovis ammon polii]